jgi:hypothetical protein
VNAATRSRERLRQAIEYALRTAAQVEHLEQSQSDSLATNIMDHLDEYLLARDRARGRTPTPRGGTPRPTSSTTNRTPKTPIPR